MALRNAFEGMATDALLRRVLSAVNFARDSGDRLIVNLASGTVSGLNQINWGANNAYPSWYSTGAPNSIDQRDLYRQAMRANAIYQRQNRWVIS